MTDEIFRSMKAQMEPSDDVVADLLSKIALETPAPATENGNVVTFRQSAGVESVPRKLSAKKKSIWYYGTAVAASIIVMISTFALLDPADEGGSDGVGNLIQSILPGGDVISPVNPDDGSENPGEDPDEEAVGPGSDADGSAGTQDGQQTGGNSDGRDSDVNGSGDSHGSTGTDDPLNDDDPLSNNTTGSGQDQNPSDGSGQGEGSSNGDSPASTDNGKVTPGAAGTEDISWTSEIVSCSQVASISVSGSNYVVGSTVSKSDVGSTLETVTISLPSTSTTNAAKVKAKVCKVKNVSSEAVVALDVDGFKEPLVYANADYSPSTLGAFVSDLGLSGNISFSSTIRCQISRVGYSSNSSYKKDISSAVWTYLLGESGAERANKSSFNSGNSKALFTSTSNPTGSQMQFGVSDNGYLWISMLGKEFTFHIGSSNAIGFLEFVTGESLS